MKPGDKVKISDEQGIYTVVRRISSQEILVTTEDGLEIPLSTDKLIVTKVDSASMYSNASGKVAKKSIIQHKKAVKKTVRTKCREIDLHIKGENNYSSGVSSIELQLMRFRSELDKAVREKQSEIIFIHGVGSGKLRTMIRTIVSEIYTNCTLQDASFSRYGIGGATKIIISGGSKR